MFEKLCTEAPHQTLMEKVIYAKFGLGQTEV